MAVVVGTTARGWDRICVSTIIQELHDSEVALLVRRFVGLSLESHVHEHVACAMFGTIGIRERIGVTLSHECGGSRGLAPATKDESRGQHPIPSIARNQPHPVPFGSGIPHRTADRTAVRCAVYRPRARLAPVAGPGAAVGSEVGVHAGRTESGVDRAGAGVVR